MFWTEEEKKGERRKEKKEERRKEKKEEKKGKDMKGRDATLLSLYTVIQTAASKNCMLSSHELFFLPSPPNSYIWRLFSYVGKECRAFY